MQWTNSQVLRVGKYEGDQWFAGGCTMSIPSCHQFNSHNNCIGWWKAYMWKLRKKLRIPSDDQADILNSFSVKISALANFCSYVDLIVIPIHYSIPVRVHTSWNRLYFLLSGYPEQNLSRYPMNNGIFGHDHACCIK